MTTNGETGMRLVLFGPPGAGKGTQAQLLSDQLQVSHISSGDLFRHNLRENTPLGLRAAEYMKQGLLVPDEVTIDIVLDKVLSLDKEEGFILDGFPRNIHQGQVLEEALQTRARPLDTVVYIDVPEGELRRRLEGRYSCRECQAPHTVEAGSEVGRCVRCGGELYQRDDDTPDAIRRRIEVYREETLPVLDFYRQRSLLTEVDGVGEVDGICQAILSGLGRVPKEVYKE